VEWDELKARPRVLEKIPTCRWAEQTERLDPVVDLPNEQGDEEFAVYSARVATPHCVFV
jgi:hypothetical protein